MPTPTHIKAKIASGETVGVAVDLRGKRLLGVQTPADLTGTTLTWHVSPTETGTYDPAFHLSTLAATATVITSVADNKYIMLPDDKRPSNCFLKLVSGSAEGADREFTLYCEYI